MANKNKIIAIGGISAAALVAVCAGSFAFFSDKADGVATATAGLVDISVDTQLNLTNSTNINPGDNDPDNPEGHRDGTAHDLSFGITNDGNKSIMTRNIITLSVDAKGGTFLDPTVYHLLATDAINASGTVADSNNRADVEVDAVYYGDEAGNFTTDKPTNCKYVRYITTQVALNGHEGTIGRETEAGLATGHLENGATVSDTGDSVDYMYRLMMEHQTMDMYEESVLTIKVETQAMQYRNTADGTWDIVFTDMLTLNPTTPGTHS